MSAMGHNTEGVSKFTERRTAPNKEEGNLWVRKLADCLKELDGLIHAFLSVRLAIIRIANWSP